ncbi:MAG: hypothetical protein JXC32_06255 [Anaerolineae bacterium]|nr:hypothetical protein [Anaerolineae bacterium]
MPYGYATDHEDHTDYASGRVLYSLPGQPAFPVRLVSEIFQRCLAMREASGLRGLCTLYDPCCGGAYHLTTLAYLHWGAIDQIIASDVSEEAVALAQRNLSLLALEGLESRAAKIAEMLKSYGKDSHATALESAQRLRSRLLSHLEEHPIETRVFRADTTIAEELRAGLQGTEVDIVLADVPYGETSEWQQTSAATDSGETALWQMLEALRGVVSSSTVVAIATGKQQKVAHAAYRRLDRFNLGRRRIEILKLA